MLPSPNPELAVEHGLFSLVQAREAGHTPRDIARGVERGRWKRLSRGVLMACDHEWGGADDLLFALLAAGSSAVVAHRSAAEIHEWDLLKRPGKAELIVRDLSRASSARLFRSDLTADEVVLDGLLRVTTPPRTALDLACRLEQTEAVVALDSAYRSGTLRPSEAEQAWLYRPGMRGHRRAARVLDLACALAGSVPESETRLLIASAGLPAPVPQYELVLDGVLVGRFDFAWEALRLLVEVDGRRYHSGDEAYQNDRTRSNVSQLGGWLILRYTVDDVRLRPDRMVAEIQEALAR